MKIDSILSFRCQVQRGVVCIRFLLCEHPSDKILVTHPFGRVFVYRRLFASCDAGFVRRFGGLAVGKNVTMCHLLQVASRVGRSCSRAQ